METFLPRMLAIVILALSVAMLAPIGWAAVQLARGMHPPHSAVLIPLAILATGTVLSWLLTRKAVPLRLYLAAFALWVLTGGYFLAVQVLPALVR